MNYNTLNRQRLNKSVFSDVAKIRGIIAPIDYYIASADFCQPKKHTDMDRFADYVLNERINVIINVSEFAPTPELIKLYKGLGIRSVFYPLEDKILERSEYGNLTRVLNNIYLKINEWKEKNENQLKVLVHCAAGINRSALVISHQLALSTEEPVHKIIYSIRHANFENRQMPALTNDTFVNLLNIVR